MTTSTPVFPPTNGIYFNRSGLFFFFLWLNFIFQDYIMHVRLGTRFSKEKASFVTFSRIINNSVVRIFTFQRRMSWMIGFKFWPHLFLSSNHSRQHQRKLLAPAHNIFPELSILTQPIPLRSWSLCHAPSVLHFIHCGGGGFYLALRWFEPPLFYLTTLPCRPLLY